MLLLSAYILWQARVVVTPEEALQVARMMPSPTEGGLASFFDHLADAGEYMGFCAHLPARSTFYGWHVVRTWVEGKKKD